MAEFEIDGGGVFGRFADELADAAEQVDEEIEAALRTTALQVEADAKENAPVDTGTLRNSIKSIPAPEDRAFIVGTGVSYADKVEFGTDPHIITPNNDEPLRFKTEDGEFVSTYRVKHPGTPAQPFLRPAVRENESELRQSIADVIESLFDEVDA
jgi:HK97 gp10 family phage protein